MQLTNTQTVRLERGAFLLSLDTEFAWGMIHRNGVEENMRLYARTRKVTEQFIELLEQYEISATWAVIGHLMLESCAPRGGVKHPEIVRPAYEWFDGDWFDQDPASDKHADPVWYWPEIVGWLKACRTPQEIGSHTFSHITVDDPGCSREAFASDLDACLELARHHGIEIRSFVYPRNRVGHLDVLIERGFTSYRGEAPSWYGDFPWHAWRVAHKLDNFAPHATRVVYPEYRGGIWNLPASYYYPHATRSRRDWGRWLPVWTRVAKVRRGLAAAAESGGMVHIWFHPYNLAGDPERLLAGLEDIFKVVRRMREAGKIDNPTMGDLAARLTEIAAPHGASARETTQVGEPAA